jgi:hypothetical protein
MTIYSPTLSPLSIKNQYSPVYSKSLFVGEAGDQGLVIGEYSFFYDWL